MRRPTCTYVYRPLAHISPSLTTVNVDIAEFQTNLATYPRIFHAFQPRSSNLYEAYHEQLSVAVTMSALGPSPIMVKCDHRHGRYRACCRVDVFRVDVLVAGVLRLFRLRTL